MIMSWLQTSLTAAADLASSPAVGRPRSARTPTTVCNTVATTERRRANDYATAMTSFLTVVAAAILHYSLKLLLCSL